MLHRPNKLLKRFILCYLLAVLIPIIVLSGIIYQYYARQRVKEYTTDHTAALVMEQNSLDTQLRAVQQYYTDFRSDYELRQLLQNIHSSERKIVYAYNTQIHSLLSNIRLYDSNVDSISIYTDNDIAARILKEFHPLSSQPFSENPYKPLENGIWKKEVSYQSVNPVFYISFTNPPMEKYIGVLKICFNLKIFENYAARLPDSSIYVYLNNEILCSYHTDISDKRAAYYKKIFSDSDSASPQILLDEEQNCVISSFTLENGSFRIIKLDPANDTLFSYKPFILSLILSGCLLIFASVIVFLFLFRAMHRIVSLSEHMNRQDAPRLTAYTGTVSNDETGELALAFNRMTEHINELSDNLLNNELQLRNAQIESLQSQLNPHFFYGTLESIRMIAEMNHQTLISEIAFSFGNLMRYSLSREYVVPISRELDIIRQYLSIQEKRQPNRFDVIWEIPELDEKFRCPKFAIFSMVENVFSHNVSKCRDFIHITISVTVEQQDILITVRNTGPGISPERLFELHYLLEHPDERGSMKSENNGRSIFNISDRLKLFYGENYQFTIDSEQGAETVCSIRVHR